MQRGEEPRVDDAVSEIAALLAVAYQRRARIRLVHPPPEPLPPPEPFSPEPLSPFSPLTGSTPVPSSVTVAGWTSESFSVSVAE